MANDCNPQNEPKKEKTFHRVNPESVGIVKMTAIIERYNKAHETSYTYGKFVDLVDSGKIRIEGDLIDC